MSKFSAFDNRCVVCGEQIPEGRIICLSCENTPSYRKEKRRRKMKNNKKSVVIEPCPFCGGVAEIKVVKHSVSMGAFVRCKDCATRGPRASIHDSIKVGKTIYTSITSESERKGIERAILAWNVRKSGSA